MKLLQHDRQKGSMKLRVETLDDLWTLRNLIQPGDLVTASTTRTAEKQDDKIRAEKSEKKRMTLGIRVEEVSFHEFDDHLRLLGIIETGPQDHGRHHTLLVRDDNETVTVQKRGPLQAWQLREVRDAEAATQRPQVVLLAIDDSEAQFGLLKAYGLQVIGTLQSGGQGKRFAGSEAAKESFYDEALKSLKTLRKDPAMPLLVVGPGWWREEFLVHAQAKEPQAVAGALTDGTAQGGRAGLHEAVRRGMVERLARDHRVQAETELVDRLLAGIAKATGQVAYGTDEVRAAVEAAAAEDLLVTDDLVRHGDQDALLQAADQTGCNVHVVATSHQAGQQLQQLGGIAALLRFAIG